MINQDQPLSGYQAAVFIVASVIGNLAFLAIPAVKVADEDGWMSILMACPIVIVIGISFIQMSSRFPNQTWIQFMPGIVGAFLGKSIGIVFILSFWVLAGLALREWVEKFRIFMPKTPLFYFVCLFAVLLIYLLKKGIAVLAHTAEIFIPIAIFTVIIIVILNLRDVEWKTLLPMMEEGVSPPLKGSAIQMLLMSKTVLFMGVWLPLLNKQTNATKLYVSVLLFIGLLFSFVTAAMTAMFGSALLKHQLFPVFRMSEFIRIGQIFSGFEMFYMLFGFSSGIFLVVTFLYPAVLGLAQWLNVKDHKPFIVPMILLSVMIAMTPSSYLDTSKLSYITQVYLVAPLLLLIPILWLISWIRGLGVIKS